MTGFVDPTDRAVVEQVLTTAVHSIGLEAVLAQLSSIVRVRVGRAGSLLRPAQPTVVDVGDELLSVPARGRAVLQHVVGGIVLSSDPVGASALPGVLAGLVLRSLADSGGHDAAAVLLTSLRDAVAAGGSTI